MAEEQVTIEKSDEQIKYEALKEQYDKMLKESQELKHRIATLELEKAVPPTEDPSSGKGEEEHTEDTLDTLIDEAVARIKSRNKKE